MNGRQVALVFAGNKMSMVDRKNMRLPDQDAAE